MCAFVAPPAPAVRPAARRGLTARGYMLACSLRPPALPALADGEAAPLAPMDAFALTGVSRIDRRKRRAKPSRAAAGLHAAAIRVAPV